MKKKKDELVIEFGPQHINGHAVGIVMKELVRRAMVVIRREQQKFEINEKVGYSGKMDDVFTSADTAAQEIYLKSLRECFPYAGIVAEEDRLIVRCKRGCKAYFTIDPLDGTKAFIRRQSHGVGTMIALVVEGKVVAAYVGDINTREIYGFRPGSEKVFRITGFDTCEQLGVKEVKPFSEQYVLLRDPDFKLPTAVKTFAQRVFKNELVDGSSIGTWMARIWKGEVAAGILENSGPMTPWDWAPIIGISERLGYVFLQARPENNYWIICSGLSVPKSPINRNHPLIIVHQDNVMEIIDRYIDLVKRTHYSL